VTRAPERRQVTEPSRSQHERFAFGSLDALRRTIAGLGLDIPIADDVSVLMQPLEIAGRRVANRIAIQPMEGCDADKSGAPTELTHRRYRRYALGGSGLIWIEATAVEAEGRSNPRQLYLTEATLDGFESLVRAIRQAVRERYGNSRYVPLVVQLTHSGRYAGPDGTPRPVITQRNPILDPLSGIDDDSALLGDEQLDRLQDRFVHAAELAGRAGFDGVDIKACNGYLVSELLASFNRDKSKYGGTFENRSRFLLEVVERIRAGVPGVFVTSRVSGHDGIRYPYGFGSDSREPPEPDLKEPRELVRRLSAAGCPILNMSVGNPYHRPHYGRPFDKPERGERPPREHPLVSVGRLVGIAAELQEAAGDTVMVGTGYSWLRQFFPHVGAAVIMSGGAGMIGLGRCAFAYPDAPADLAEHGSLDPKKMCITCSSCTQIMRDGGRAGCVLRDAEVYGKEYRRGRERARRRRDEG